MTTTRKPTSKRRNYGDLLGLFKEIVDILERYGKEIVKFSTTEYHKLKLRFHGKSISIIGPKAAGKSTFLNILQDNNFDVDTMLYTPTQGSIEIENFKINYKVPLQSGENKSESITLKMKKPKDVGGEVSYRDNGEWLNICKDSDYIFYIFDAFEFTTNEKMKKRVYEDLEWIAENNQIYKQNFGIVIFANKIDKINESVTEWANKHVKNIESDTKRILNDFKNHLKLITPISLQSKSTRANAISNALLKVAER